MLAKILNPILARQQASDTSFTNWGELASLQIKNDGIFSNSLGLSGITTESTSQGWIQATAAIVSYIET